MIRFLVIANGANAVGCATRPTRVRPGLGGFCFFCGGPEGWLLLLLPKVALDWRLAFCSCCALAAGPLLLADVDGGPGRLTLGAPLVIGWLDVERGPGRLTSGAPLDVGTDCERTVALYFSRISAWRCGNASGCTAGGALATEALRLAESDELTLTMDALEVRSEPAVV